MKRKITKFTGQRPVFSGSPSIVPGGFNLDTTNQSFNVGDVVPEGSLAIMDEQTRKVKIVKTAKVATIDADDAKKITLKVEEFFAPMFVAGEKVMKVGSIAGAYSSAPSISKQSFKDGVFSIELSAAINGLAVGDVLQQVISKSETVAEIVAGIIVTHGANDHVYMVTPGLAISAGDKVMNYPLASSPLIANAIAVTSYDKLTGKLVLASDPTNAAAGDKVVVVYADDTAAVATKTVANVAEIGIANCVTVSDVDVSSDETAIDVTADTMQYALYERRVAPIPATQKDASGLYLKGNFHVKLSQSF